MLSVTCDVVASEQVDLQVGAAGVPPLIRGPGRELSVLLRLRAPALQVAVQVSSVQTPR